MARQRGVIRLEGAVGDVTFFRTKHGFFARERRTVTAEAIATSPKFQRTRENMEEFGRAGKSSKLFRDSLSDVIKLTADKSMRNRLLALFMKIIHTDAVNPRGKRNVIDGEAELLRNFEFNSTGLLTKTLLVKYESEIDRAAGTVKFKVPGFVPQDLMVAPVEATHYRIVMAAAEIDFENETSVSDMFTTAYEPIDSNLSALINQTLNLTPASVSPLFAILGIDFAQETNGVKYPLRSGKYNPLTVINVDY